MSQAALAIAAAILMDKLQFHEIWSNVMIKSAYVTSALHWMIQQTAVALLLNLQLTATFMIKELENVLKRESLKELHLLYLLLLVVWV